MIAKWLCVLSLCLVGCSDDTGSGLVSFSAYAAGPSTAVTGKSFEFNNRAGYHVRLNRARLTIGALYLNRAKPILGAQDTPCVLPGLYAAEVRSRVVIDALSPELVEFEGPGEGTANRALTGEIWLTGGAIDELNDNTKILEFAGTATKDELNFGFYGAITIGQNRALGSPDPATPGANPICKQRIISPVPTDITPSSSGRLELRVSPEIWFNNVDFSQLPDAVGQGEELEIPDHRENVASVNLFQGLHSVEAYQFAWRK
jgi:hypothetical protein